MNRMVTSGNQTVDSMASVNITGNVTPVIWYKTILRPSGKPHMLAVAMLSDIVYWYRPTEIRDEQTGFIIGWQKRFKGEYLQKSYANFESMFGETRRSVKLALNTLIDVGVVRKFFKDVRQGDRVFYNTMFLDLNLQRLLELTFPDRYPSDIPYYNTACEDSDENSDAFENDSEGMMFIDEAEEESADELAESQENVSTLDSVYEKASSSSENAVIKMQDESAKEFAAGSIQNTAPFVSGINENPEGANGHTPVHPRTEGCTSMYPPLYTGVPTPVHPCTEGCTSMYPPLYADVPTPIHQCTEGCTSTYPPLYTDVPTNTKNTTEITTETTTENTTQNTLSGMDGMESINPSIPETDSKIKQMQADIASIREHIGYDWQMEHGDYRTRKRFGEMFNLMCDIICVNEPYVNLGGSKVPYFRVREKLLQITGEHLAYVMECIDKNSGSIGNIQAYTLKSIYNAPSSIESYYAHEANHDMNFMG